ncbi:hypothetical protein MY3296_007613 [Beauveria thailandica]
MKSGPGAKPRSPSHGRVCPLASQLLAEPQAGRRLEQKSGWLLGNITAPLAMPDILVTYQARHHLSSSKPSSAIFFFSHKYANRNRLDAGAMMLTPEMEIASNHVHAAD